MCHGNQKTAGPAARLVFGAVFGAGFTLWLFNAAMENQHF
jgi:hypothetical protein